MLSQMEENKHIDIKVLTLKNIIKFSMINSLTLFSKTTFKIYFGYTKFNKIKNAVFSRLLTNY